MWSLLELTVLCLLAYAQASAAPPLQLHRPHRHTTDSSTQELQALYLWTLKNSLTGVLLETPYYNPSEKVVLSEWQPYDENMRYEGLDWPAFGLTMTGVRRLDNLHSLITHLHNSNVPGNLIECGVWRGGASIFMRGVLKAYNIMDRTVHLVDSFDGLPVASTSEDHNGWQRMDYLKVPRDKVEASFRRYNLLDDQVQFHTGYFRNSLPNFRKEYGGQRIALLRMDGDMYESTMDILFNLFDFLSPGACIVVDDWSISVCQKAMKEFFGMHKINPNIVHIDSISVYFCLDETVELQRSWYEEFNSNRSA